MARGYTTRKLELFSVHLKGPPRLDYVDFFVRVLAATLPQVQIGEGRLVSVVPRESGGGIVTLVAYEGEEGVVPLIFDPSAAGERFQRLRAGEIVATNPAGGRGTSRWPRSGGGGAR